MIEWKGKGITREWQGNREMLLDPNYVIYKCYICNTTFRGFPNDYCLYCDVKQDVRTKGERTGFQKVRSNLSELDYMI